MASLSMSGWLEKRGGQDATKGWKKRWCELSDHLFRYYKNDSDKEPAGIIYAEDIQDVVQDLDEAQKDISKHGFTFRLVTKGRNYVFNAASNSKRDEWISKVKKLVAAHSEESILPKLKYSTVEIFYGPRPGIRVNGDLETELMMSLTSAAGKTTKDERGWFGEVSTTHTAVLNQFTQHGWKLMSALPCNSVPSTGTQAAHSDMLIFTHPLT